MSMILITQKSILSDSELKAYKLINRLRYRTLLKDVNASIIYHSLKMIQLRKKFKKKNINNQKIFEREFNTEKAEIFKQMEKYKIYNEMLKASDKVQTKDQLIDILEQIEKNIHDIEEELIILQRINTSFQGYKQTQQLMLKYLRSNILNTQFIYDILQRNRKIFGVLSMEPNTAEKEKHKLQQEIDLLYINYHKNRENYMKNKEKVDVKDNLIFNIKRNSIKLNKKKSTLYVLNDRSNRNSRTDNTDIFKWDKFFLPITVQNIVGKKQKKNKRHSNASDFSRVKRNESGVWSTTSTVMGDGRKIYPEDLYARELQKYNVDQNDYSKYFYLVFFQKNDSFSNFKNKNNSAKNLIQNVIMRNSPKVLSSIKVMKNIKEKLNNVLQKYKESSNASSSSSNSMDENKEDKKSEN